MTQMTNADPQPATERWPWFIAWLLVAGALVGFRQLHSWDVWWHLLVGKVIVHDATWLPTEVFSYSADGVPWAYKDWLGDVLLYGAYACFGEAGLALWRTVAAAGIGVGLWLTIPADQRRPAILLFCAGLCLVAVESRLIPRPVLFTIGILPIALGLLHRLRTNPTLPCLGAAVGLQWLWLNLHRGGLLGLVLLGGLTAVMGLAYATRNHPGFRSWVGPGVDGKQAFRVAAATAIALLLGLLTPNGLALYSSAWTVTHSSAIRDTVSEWHPLTFAIATGHAWLSVVVIAIGWLTLLQRWVRDARSSQPARSLHLWHAMTLLLATAMALSAVRFLPVASIVAGQVLAIELSRSLVGASFVRLRGTTALVGVVTAALVHLTTPAELGTGPAPHRYPSGAMAFAREHNLGPRVHNTFVYGGYVLWSGWPQYRDLIDGRHDMVFSAELFFRCLAAQSDPGAFADLDHDLPGDWVLASNFPGRQTFVHLSRNPDWLLVYWSEAAVIYVRRNQAADLERLAFRFVSPSAPVPSLGRALSQAQNDPVALAAIETELLRILAEDGDSVRANSLLVLYYYHLGPAYSPQMEAQVRILQKLAPDHPAVKELLRRIRPGAARTEDRRGPGESHRRAG